jgi:hypothetical protein
LSQAESYDICACVNCTFNIHDLEYDLFYLDDFEPRAAEVEEKISKQTKKQTYVLSTRNYSKNFGQTYLPIPQGHLKTSFLKRVSEDMDDEVGSINTGYISILHLLEHEIKSLTITGIDFHRSAYQDKYRCNTGNGFIPLKTTDDIREAFEPGKKSNHHNPDKQYLHFKNFVYDVDKRVVVDEHMKTFMSDEKYNIIFGSDNEPT